MQQKPCEKKAQEIREKSGGKYLPLISVSGSRLPVMHLPVTSGDLISGDATSGDDPPHGPLQIRPGYILLSCHIYKRCELESRSGEVYFIQHYVRFMVLNAIFNNISVISWRQFYW